MFFFPSTKCEALLGGGGGGTRLRLLHESFPRSLAAELSFELLILPSTYFYFKKISLTNWENKMNFLFAFIFVCRNANSVFNFHHSKALTIHNYLQLFCGKMT